MMKIVYIADSLVLDGERGIRMRTIMSLRAFARIMGFKRSDDKEFSRLCRFLRNIAALKIQQSGFLGDSMHHDKLIVVKDWRAVKTAFGQVSPPSLLKRKHPIIIYQYRCRADFPCICLRVTKRQGAVCTFMSTCNQQVLES